MRKKIIAGITCAMLIGAMVLPVSAEETPVTATVDSTYELTIPAQTDIAYNATSTSLNGIVAVKGNVLPNQIVTVSATPGNLHNSEQNTDLPYTLVISNTTQQFSSDIWNETQLRERLNGGEGKTVSLSVNITENDWRNAEAGTYTGNITFTAELSPVTNQ